MPSGVYKRKPFSEEHKRNISQIAKKLNFGKWMIGKKHSEEHIKNISKALKGRKKKLFTKRHRRNMSLSHKGYKMPEEQKRKISKSLKGIFVGNKNINWKGGKIISSKGYVYIKKSEHPFTNKNGYILRSHLVMEQKIGRSVQPEEVVHHINGKRDDDRIENLQLFANDFQHAKFHKLGTYRRN